MTRTYQIVSTNTEERQGAHIYERQLPKKELVRHSYRKKLGVHPGKEASSFQTTFRSSQETGKRRKAEGEERSQR